MANSSYHLTSFQATIISAKKRGGGHYGGGFAHIPPFCMPMIVLSYFRDFREAIFGDPGQERGVYNAGGHC